ncbi:MAG: hypothetical protein ABSG41_14815 [Bryobacteraceae bacterium]|jgi:hypothetical protein
MQFDWILNPVTQYAVIGVGLLGSLALWITAKFELRAVRGEVSDSHGAIEGNVRELSATLNQLRAEREIEGLPAAQAIGQGLNLTKRAHVVRMHRRGETVPSIAAALQTPANEVELILKVERLLNSRTQ